MENDIKAILSQLLENTAYEINPNLPKDDLPAIYLEIPKDSRNGNFSSNIALKLASKLKQDPLTIAKDIVRVLKDKLISSLSEIERVEVKPPGFINFFIKEESLFSIIREILSKEDDFGRRDIGKQKMVQIEFVSANPTGPLSLAHARQAAVGDSLSRVLEFLNFRVAKEYYLNDCGNQINILGRSVEARCLELIKENFSFPEDGYKGKYIYDIAREIIKDANKSKSRIKKLKESFFSGYAVKYILKTIKHDLREFRVRFDVWYSQKKLEKSGKIESVIDSLKQKGYVYEKDGAFWLMSTSFGDDKDRVVVKSDGNFTYLAPDIAYHKEKYERGFNWVINLWGPDHHGYIRRLKAGVTALGYNEEQLTIIIVQLCSLFKDGKAVSMSTRQGEFISLRELLSEVGTDAVRFFFLMRRTSSHLDFDLTLAKKQSPENPVYYVQYAHARIASILKKAEKQKIGLKETELSRLKENEEIDLVKKLSEFPDCLEAISKSLDPNHLTLYLQDLSGCFHRFYDRHRVVGEDLDLTKERIMLVKAVKIVLSRALSLIGVKAPKSM